MLDSVIANIADRVTVMYHGSIVETGLVRQVLLSPKHDYTKKLLSAIPHPNPIGREKRKAQRLNK